MDGLDLGVLTDFRAARIVAPKTETDAPRPISPTTSGKELETCTLLCLRQKARWIPENTVGTSKRRLKMGRSRISLAVATVWGPDSLLCRSPETKSTRS